MLDPVETLDRRARLARLEGRLCPICHARGQMRVLTFSGGQLGCMAAHGWRNPDVAEAEITLDRPRSAEYARKMADAGRMIDEAARADARRLLERLERTVGDWLPPEARKS